jgi:hypothetical protein
MEENKEKRSDLINAVHSPLGFFALSLLIVEGFLTITLIFSNLESESKFYGMIIGAGLFVLVVLGVWVLVWFKPKNIIFGQEGHLLNDQLYGNNKNPEKRSAIENTNKLTSPISKE